MVYFLFSSRTGASSIAKIGVGMWRTECHSSKACRTDAGGNRKDGAWDETTKVTKRNAESERKYKPQAH